MSAAIHAAAAAGALDTLTDVSAADLIDHMPLLVRHAVAAASEPTTKRPMLLTIAQLSGASECLDILSQDFDAISSDVRAGEQQRIKARTADEPLAIPSFVQFDEANTRKRMVLLISEVLRLNDDIATARRGGREARCTSPLLDPDNLADTILPCLCFAISELSEHTPMATVLDVLLHVGGCERLALRVVLNFPALQGLVLAALLRHAGARDAWLAEAVATLLQTLAARLPAWAVRIRTLLAHDRCLPVLFLQLLADAPDLVPALAGLVRSESQLSFLVAAMTSPTGAGRTATALVRQRLAALASAAVATQDTAAACALLGIGAVLGAVAAVPPLAELEAWVALATAPWGTSCVRFVKLALCVVLCLPGAAALERVPPWLQRLAELSRVRTGSDSYAELLLLLAIHAHGGRPAAIAHLLRQVLAAKIEVPADRIRRSADTLLRPLFPEPALAKQALAAPPTPALHAGLHGFLPIHCVTHLLESRAFARFQIDVRPWLLNQIRLCSPTQPVHEALVDAVRLYAGFCVSPLGAWVGSGDEAAKDLSSLLRDCPPLPCPTETAMQQLLDAGHEVARALVLFFVFSFLHARKRWLERAATQQAAVAAPVPPALPTAFLEGLPVRETLRAMHARNSPARSLYPMLVPLVTNHMPHHRLPSGLLRQQGRDELHCSTVGNATRWMRVQPPPLPRGPQQSLHSAPTELAATLTRASTDPGPALAALDGLMRLPPTEVKRFASPLLDILLPQLAQPAIHPTLRQHFRTLWLALQGAMPTELLPWTLHRMGGPNLSHAQLASDPLAVLRQPRTVLQTPELLEIVLIILENYSFVSRAAAAEQASVVRQRTADAAERAVLMHTLLQAQEAAAVQLLIELCVPNKNEEPDPDVCAHVCRYIHAAFVGNPGLPRAILDAGFPPAALPVLVAGVPSLHVCLDFLPTLMEVDDLALQAFAVRVTGALAPAYPVPKALVAARAAFGRLHAATYLDPGARERFFECALPAVPLMCAAFPPLADAAAVLLVKLRNTEAAAAAGQMGGSSLSAGSTSLQQLLDVTFAQLAEKAILANALFM
eukprot:m.111642 g.111642  ORF g.111642 m.111642 type:complete len:1062 (+) comp14358_c0_seq2:89-3274(+)